VDEAGQSGLADPPAAATVRFLQDLAASGLMRLGGGMGDGLSAMAIAPPWWRQGLMAAAAADYPNLRTTLMPAGDGQPTAYQYGWGLFVTAASPHAREAWEFLRWLAMSPGPRSATRMGEHMVQLGSLPTNPWDIDRIDVFREDPFYAGFIESLKVARAEPALPQMSLRHEAIAQILGPAIEGRVPIGTAIAQAAERVETILAEAAQNAP
ncbi:MAG TPA: extracellular solute-binding protein, partial [Limnochordia bacterium]